MASLEHRHAEEINKLTITLHNLRNIAKTKNYFILLARARKIVKSEEKKKFKIQPNDVLLIITLIFATIYHFIDIDDFICKIIIKLNLEFMSQCI